MLKFLGFDLELTVDDIVDPASAVRSAQDFLGEHWLIIQVDDNPEHLIWICAPISIRALREVAAGRATATDAARHSSTGTVEVVTVDHGRAVPDRCLRCAAIPDLLLPVPDRELVLSA